MKKIFTLTFIGLFLSTYAQLPVSQTPEKKRVVLEEFTGKDCTWCPAGHKIAAEMKDADPENVFLINVHTGGFAAGSPNYRTSFGDALANQSGLTGYPAGTVNRHAFNGATATATDRGQWAGNAASIRSEDAYVNVAVEATIDLNTRELTVNLEAYYTANANASTNYINVAITQDDIRGPQVGTQNYPEMVDDNGDYIHNHMLRHLITGQWGEEITTVSAGDLVERSYTYTLPASIGDVDMDSSKLHIVAFISETQQEIINGNETSPALTGLPNTLEAQVLSVNVPEYSCSAIVEPKLSVRNWGNDEITSLKIEYFANDLPTQIYDWTGSILGGLTESITLPELPFNSMPTNNLVFKILKVNGTDDEDLSTNEITASVSAVDEHNANSMTLSFESDQYSATVDSNGDPYNENSWKLFNSAGNVIQEAVPGDVTADTMFSIPLNLPDNDCYKFEFYDSYGDGLTDGGASGEITLDINGTSISLGSGQFKTLSYEFATVDAQGNGNGNPTNNVDTSSTINIVDIAKVTTFDVYPNPAVSILNVKVETKANEAVSVQLVDVLGRTVATQEAVNTIATFNTSKLNKGIYLVNVVSEGRTIATSSVVVK